MSSPPIAENPNAETYARPEKPKSKTGCILLGVGGGCLIVVLVCAGLVGAGVFGLSTAIKSSDPYTESLQRAQTSDEVGSKLGQPVEPGFMVQGNINLNNDDGEANLNYSITGPEGSATVDVAGKKTDGVWNYNKMQVKTDDGSVIDLLEDL